MTPPSTQVASSRPPIALLGVPFDHVTTAEAIERIERMVASRAPHYLVTANVDFLVQARTDVELRRILLDAHLVLCDGTPLLWASRLLGHPLPERVAGADLVPLLIQVAARKKYRLFFLGATAESSAQAVARLQAQFPALVIAGSYSPPFKPLLEMDHEEIQRRIREAQPDLVFVSFGCPKQEKWIAMHYRRLGVPVAVGVGATIDFLAGQVRRAPLWMRRAGLEWLYRLAQEPRRLFRRYVQDLWVFGWALLAQWWQLQPRTRGPAPGPRDTRETTATACPSPAPVPALQFLQPRERLDLAAIRANGPLLDPALVKDNHCLLALDQVRFIDSAGVGYLVRLQKELRAAERQLVLVAPSPPVQRVLRLLRLEDSFLSAPDTTTAQTLLQTCCQRAPVTLEAAPSGKQLAWHGEITAANAEVVWAQTQLHLPTAKGPAAPRKATAAALGSAPALTLDLSDVSFLDSSGVGVMVRAKKLATQAGVPLVFTNPQPPVRNVLRMAALEPFLLDHS